MAISYNIEVTGFLDFKGSTGTTYVKAPVDNVELFPDSLTLEDGQRDQRITGNLGILDPNDLFGHIGSNWMAFMDIANDTLPANPRILVQRLRKVPNVDGDYLNEDGPALYTFQPSTLTFDRVKFNVGIVPEGYVLAFSAVDEDAADAPIVGPWRISLTVGRLRSAMDYDAICVL